MSTATTEMVYMICGETDHLVSHCTIPIKDVCYGSANYDDYTHEKPAGFRRCDPSGTSTLTKLLVPPKSNNHLVSKLKNHSLYLLKTSMPINRDITSKGDINNTNPKKILDHNL